MWYNWEIWDCRDYTQDNSAAFYRHTPGWEAYSYDAKTWEWSPQEQDTPDGSVYYMCDSASGAQCHVLSRGQALSVARHQAQEWPTYTTSATASRVLGVDFNDGGTFSIQTDNGDIATEIHSNACNHHLALCVVIDAVRSPSPV